MIGEIDDRRVKRNLLQLNEKLFAVTVQILQIATQRCKIVLVRFRLQFPPGVFQLRPDDIFRVQKKRILNPFPVVSEENEVFDLFLGI